MREPSCPNGLPLGNRFGSGVDEEKNAQVLQFMHIIRGRVVIVVNVVIVLDVVIDLLTRRTCGYATRPLVTDEYWVIKRVAIVTCTLTDEITEWRKAPEMVDGMD